MEIDDMWDDDEDLENVLGGSSNQKAMIIITTLASQLEEGDTIIYKNERYNTTVEEVSFTRDGEVRVSCNNGTSIEFYKPNELVTVNRRYDNP